MFNNILEENIFAETADSDIQFMTRCQNISSAVSQVYAKQQILDSTKLKNFANDNFEFDENGTEFSKRVENTLGK